MAIEIADKRFDVADDMEQKNYFDLLTSLEVLQCPCQTIL